MNWYVLNKDGVATLCASEQNARDEAEVYDRIYPGGRPHTATPLVPAYLLGEARLNALRYLFLRRYGLRISWTNVKSFSPGYRDGDAEELDADLDSEIEAIAAESDDALEGANAVLSRAAE